jgi:hypothetical protein
MSQPAPTAPSPLPPTPARPPRLRAALSAALLLLILASPRGAAAQPAGGGATGKPAAPTTPVAGAAAKPAPAGPVEVRFGLSPAAAENLSETRLRRLLDIELPDSARLSPGAAGPLGEQVAYVWIDRPTPARLEIQVRVAARPVVRREIAISGLTSDVATRLVAIAASEIIRAEVRRLRAPRRPPPPRRPSPEEVELASRDLTALSLGAGPYAAVIAGEPSLLAGPGLAVSIRRLRVTEGLFARWLAGPLGDGALRWLEAGAAVDYHLWAGPSWRFSLGAAAAIASLHLSEVSGVDGLAGEEDTWSARAGAALGVEVNVGGPLWLGLTLEPGAVLRPAPYESASGATGSVEGAWIGLGLALSAEGREAQPAH